MISHHFKNLANYIIRSRPFELTVFLTSVCNFKCEHCFYWRNLNNKDQLTLKEFKKLARNMPYVERLIFTGGEPFLRKDIDEIVNEFYIYSSPMYITIPTNGYFTDKIIEKTEIILTKVSKCFVNISLSLDEIGVRRDEIVKVPGSFDNLVKTYMELKKLQYRFKNLGITVICTQTATNEDRLEKIYEYAKNELKVDNFGFSVVRGNPAKTDIKDISPEKYRHMYKRILGSYSTDDNSENIPLHKLYLYNRELVYKYTYKTIINNTYQIKCYAGILRAVILENGDVYPCEVLMDNGGEYLIGNLKTYDMDFKKLWKSQKRKDVIQKIKEKRCFCTHGCDMTINILFGREFPMQVMKNQNYQL